MQGSNPDRTRSYGIVLNIPEAKADQLRQALIQRRQELETEISRYDWRRLARQNQLAPDGHWKIWLLLAGRGFGKTRTGAEWAREQVEKKGKKRIALVGATSADVRDVMVEGESGLLAVCPPWCRPLFEPSKRRLSWPNGAIATMYSADEPERLRGPQHDAAWCDELAAWRYEAAWHMLMFGLRLGDHPQVVISTTPKPVPLLFRICKHDVNKKAPDGTPIAVVTSGSTYENAANLAPSFIEEIAQYEGTELGRQEIHAELIDFAEHAILKPSWWKDWTDAGWPRGDNLVTVFASIDTATGIKEVNDYSACTVWAVFRDDTGSERILLINAWKDRLEFHQLLDRIEQTAKKYKRRHKLEVDRFLIENKLNGGAVIQELRRRNPERVIHAIEPRLLGGDKVARAHACSDILKSGYVYAPKRFDWAQMVIDDCSEFPNAEHDDVTDTVTQALNYLRANGVALYADESLAVGSQGWKLTKPLY